MYIYTVPMHSFIKIINTLTQASPPTADYSRQSNYKPPPDINENKWRCDNYNYVTTYFPSHAQRHYTGSGGGALPPPPL